MKRNNCVWIFVLLFSAMFIACKAPVAPVLSQAAQPSLILVAPDSAALFDSVIVRVISSVPYQPGRQFRWDFGDSTELTTTDSVVKHSFKKEGLCHITIAIFDSVANRKIYTTDKYILIKASHFDYGLLMAMHHLRIECYGMDTGSHPHGILTNVDQSSSFLSWVGDEFSGSYSDGRQMFDWHGDSIRGGFDAAHTMIAVLHGSFWGEEWQYSGSGNNSRVEGYDFRTNDAFSVVHFKTQSDSVTVFEEICPLPANASYVRNVHGHSGVRSGYDTYSKYAINWSDTSMRPRVTITFHK